MISVSDRAKTIFTRWGDLSFKNIIDLAKKKKDDSDYTIDSFTFGKHDTERLVIEIQSYGRFHNDSCEDDNFIPYDGSCDCDAGSFMIEFGLIYYSANSNVPLFLDNIEFDDIDEVKEQQIKDWINQFQSIYRLCQCGKIVCNSPNDLQTKWCTDCYVHRYTRTEEQGGDCCICSENEGRWLRMSCGHEVHSHCFIRMAVHKNDNHKLMRKCPLCRKELSYDSYEGLDCYNV